MGLRPSRFFWSLIEKSPTTIPEILQHANQYIAAEALMAGRHEDNKRPRMETNLRRSPWALPQGTRRSNSVPWGLVKRQIDIISGGPTAGGNNSTARKAYARSRVDKCPKLEFEPEITFGTEEVERSHYDDALVISIRIANARVKRIMVDTWSSTDVLYLDAFKKLGLTNEDLTPMNSALTGFTEDSISPLGTTTLPVTIGKEPRAKMTMTTFMVVDLPSAYNIILSRLTLNKLKAIVSTYHRAIKFPTSVGVRESRSDPRESRRCYLTAVTLLEKSRPRQDLDPREEGVTPMHLEPPEQLTEEMPGIDQGVTQHHLNIHPEAKPVKQKSRKFSPDRQKAISDEVDRLKEAGFITEVKYPRWLSNIVLFKKHNGSWRMCVDYTDLNRACPKDCYPLPRIDQLVDATIGYELLTFMDTFLGYNQIRMAPQDQENTAFITDRGVYCYKVMPFGLKNTRATYQRMVDKLFKQ
ncbi:uncharacterized protein LOC135629222 [Musa acuminata AAA Group]|uniref:uncharacterized protein LOC135629222 n=1 Tax=Musa acuminata AAA Group TaxID=214697 RepID=UPI0031DAAA4B